MAGILTVFGLESTHFASYVLFVQAYWIKGSFFSRDGTNPKMAEHIEKKALFLW